MTVDSRPTFTHEASQTIKRIKARSKVMSAIVSLVLIAGYMTFILPGMLLALAILVVFFNYGWHGVYRNAKVWSTPATIYGIACLASTYHIHVKPIIMAYDIEQKAKVKKSPVA